MKLIRYIAIGFYLLAAACVVAGPFFHVAFTYVGAGCLVVGFLLTALYEKTGGKP